MRRTWVLSVLVVLSAALTTSCTSSTTTADPGSRSTSPSASPTSSGTKTTKPAPKTTPRTSKTPTPKSTKPVPVDQIPPGNPRSWVPKGVPTKAKYAKKGERAPRFTQAMFENNQNGAIATAVYYLDAQNWAQALNDNYPVNLVCSAERCVNKQAKFEELRAKDEHILGGRISYDRPRIKLAVIPTATWLYRVHLTTDSYEVVDSSGDTVDEYPGSTAVRTNIYLKWAGKLWTVTLQATTP